MQLHAVAGDLAGVGVGEAVELAVDHPVQARVGATGVAQICDVVQQLRGEAGERQVDGAEVAVVTNAGGFESGAALLTSWHG